MKKVRITTATLLAIACSTATAQFEGGDGSAGNPYQIATPAQLDSIREDGSENFLDDHFVLMNDLDFDDYAYADGALGWQPIAHDTRSGVSHQGGKFTGTFNGRGFAIHNLKINRPTQYYVGLFGYLVSSAEVDSLGMEAVEVLGSGNVGGLVGFQASGMITNSWVAGQVEANSNFVGGLLGANSGTINASYAVVNVKGTDSDDVGGLVGSQGSSGVIENSYAMGQVGGSGDNAIGGLVGTNRGTIRYSYAIGRVEGVSTAYGLVGNDITGAYVSNY